MQKRTYLTIEHVIASDPRFAEHVDYGFGVWSLHSCFPSPGMRSRQDGWSEARGLTLEYDKGVWGVKVRHYLSRFEEKTTGWGNSRKVDRKLITRYRETKRQFSGKDDAIRFAYSIVKAFERIAERYA